MKIALIVVLAAGAAALAGDLTPPPGPVAPTMKTLDDVEPRIAINAENTPGNAGSRHIITSPGSYYLTGDIEAGIDQHGITANLQGVTIDLNGFSIVGSEDSGLPVHGVNGANSAELSVVNGSIRLFSGNGVLGSFSMRLDRLNLSENGGNGATLGINARIISCGATSNAGSGFVTGPNGLVSDSIATGNSMNGFVAGDDSRFTSCVANGNSMNGFSLAPGGALDRCSAGSNTVSGVDAGDRCAVDSSVFTGNGSHGIDVGSSCVVRNNLSSANVFDGILGDEDNTIVWNTCTGNGFGVGGAAIRVSGSGNRIDQNSVNRNQIGFATQATGNIYTRNTSTGNNFTYVLAPGNEVGLVVSSPLNAGAWDSFNY